MEIIKLILMIGMVALIILPLASADLIDPGYKIIPVNNYIKNINDFPDYAFITISFLGGGTNDMCTPLQIIENNGEILSGGYKFCDVSVYAIKKNEFNADYIKGLNDYDLKDYLASSNVKKVIGNIEFTKGVLETSTQESITNYYTIDLSQTKTKPDDVIKGRNYLVYLYIAIPIIALALIIFIIIRRKR